MEKQWTVLEALSWTEQRFERNGEENPRLAAQMLAAHATGLTRIDLYAQFDKPLTEQERLVLRESIRRRLEGEPLQYIIGSVGFRHIELLVRAPVLIPRPETESLVELVLEYARGKKESSFGSSDYLSELTILDIGTGTGAIALSLLHELPGCKLTATDIEPAAVELAQENAQCLSLDDTTSLEVLKDNFASALISSPAHQSFYDVVVSNPPYIPTEEYESLPTEIRAYESRRALDGGEDGLAALRILAQQALHLLKPEGLLAVELHETTLNIAQEYLQHLAFEKVKIHEDLTGRSRFITALKGLSDAI